MTYDLTQPADPTLEPGEARCPGPQTRDIIKRDQDSAPAALTAESYQFLGDADIPYERYTSQEFFDREMDTVWRKTWQWACREEHIPKKGDYYTYDVGPYSVVVVRGEKDTIKAFINACPHRGMQFSDAGSSGSGKQFLRCPFHGWSWNLDGSLREVPCRWDFPHIKDEDFGLTEVPSGTWGGFVFINLDPDCEPLEDYLGVLPEHFKTWKLEDRYVQLHTRKILPGNWKMCMEAFLEAYHVLATHPEGIHTSGDANCDYDVFGKHVTRFIHTIGYPSPHVASEVDERKLFADLGHNPDDLPEGMSARQRHADIMREQLSKEWDVDLSGLSNSEMLDSIEYHVFPNAMFFPGINIRLIYRFRPIDVDHSIHEILMLQPVPEHGPRPKPAEVIELGIDDSYALANKQSLGGFGLAMVLDQDTDNFHRQRAGIKAAVKSGAKAGATLGNYQEIRVRRLHQTVDEYLNA
jgi:phenylpropionate dioxygenase-like ring-hydroxylating dioxygenase large terminal subunit